MRERLLASPVVMALLLTLGLTAMVFFSLGQLKSHILQSLRAQMVTINNSVQNALHRQAEQEVIAITQLIDDATIGGMLVEMLQHPAAERAASAPNSIFTLRRMLAQRIFAQHYAGFYLIGRDRRIIASMKTRDSGAPAPATALQAIKRLEAGEPAVVTHAFAFHHVVAMWLLRAVKDRHGAIVGYFALQLGHAHRFSAVTLNHGAFFHSGETYLTNRNGIMLSNSRFEAQLVALGLLHAGEPSFLHIRVADPGHRLTPQSLDIAASADLPLTAPLQALAAHHAPGANMDGYRDYRGIARVGVWQWDDFFNAAIITEMDRSEALRDYHYVRNLFVLVLLLVTAASVLSVFAYQRLRLRLERQRYRHKNLLLESTAEAIYGVDLQGRCTFVNRTLLDLLDYREEELLGRDMHALIHYAHADGSPYPAASCKIAKAQIQRRRVHKKRDLFWRKGERPLYVEWWAKPLFEEGALIGSVVSFVVAEDQLAPLDRPAAQPSVPAIEPTVAADDDSAAPASDANGRLVLVVEDDPMIREIACALLEEMALEAISAEDGEQGLAMYRARQREIGLVLTDLTMPKMDGKALVTAIRQIDADQPDAACRVIVCSGYSADVAAQQIDLEVDAFIQKPFMPDRFIETVEQVFGGAR